MAKDFSVRLGAVINKTILRKSIKTFFDENVFKMKVQAKESSSDISNGKSKVLNDSERKMYRVAKATENYATKLKNLKTMGSLSEEEFNNFNSRLDSLNKEFGKTKNIDEFDRSLNTLKNNVSQATTANRAHGQSIIDIIKKYTTWLGIATLVASAMNAIRGVINNVKELDASMVELNKVYDASAKELNIVKERAFELADAIGSTGKNVIDATTEFKRMGYTIEESLELAKIASMMVNVADGIDDAGDAANILTSILKGTNTEIKYAQSLLDRLNEISNNSAISFDALAHMTQESAATMKILGNNLDETMGLLTGAYEILQDESVANGIQTIGLRIAGLNEDLESVAGLSNQVVEALQKYAGINAFDEQSGQLKSTYDILEELAGVWAEIDKNQQSALLNILAGKRQADVAASVLENWNGVKDAVLNAQNSMGSALDENARAMQSIEGAQRKLTNAQQEFSDALLASGIIEGLLNIATSLVDIGTAIVSVTENAPDVVKWIYGIASAFAALALTIAVAKGALTGPAGIAAGVAAVTLGLSALGSITSALRDEEEKLNDTTEETSETYYDLSKSFEENIKSANDFEDAIGLLEQKLSNVNSELKNQIDLLKDKQEQEKKDKDLQQKLLAVEKARQELSEAKNRRVRVYRAGVGFIYESDSSEIQSAQETLTETINDLSEYRYDLALDRAEDFVTKLNELLTNGEILDGWNDLFSDFGDLLDSQFSNYLLEAKNFVDKFNTMLDDGNVPQSGKTNSSNFDIYALLPNKFAENASGTTNFKGGPTWVGEHGPELMNLPQGTEILSHNRSMKLHSIVNNPNAYVGSSSSGSGRVIQFNGPLNFPNVKNSSDAEGFVNAVIKLGNNSIPKLN